MIKLNLKYEYLYKKGGIFDILKYSGITLHIITWSILPILMWHIPEVLSFNKNSIALWHFISIFSAINMQAISLYLILLKICKDNYPNTFKIIASKSYLNFLEKNYYDK